MCYGIRDFSALHRLLEGLEEHKRWRLNSHSPRLWSATADNIKAKFAVRSFNSCVSFTFWYINSFHEDLEVMDQNFHLRIHFHLVRNLNALIIDPDFSF